MQPGEAGLALVAWQGWGVLSVLSALTALLATILAWLLPFPDRSLSRQLATYDDRVALKARLGAAPAFKTYLVTAQRFNQWLAEWFGPPLSAKAFERCVAIAFIFPVALLLITLIANGLVTDRIASWQAALFALCFLVIAFVIVVAFRNLVRLIGQGWTMVGGDKAMADTLARIVLGAFACMVAFTVSFAIASAFAGEVSHAGSLLGAMAGGFLLAIGLAATFVLAGTALFSVTLAILVGAALVFASEFTLLLFLFFVLLPLTNACVDWLSWSATRWFLSYEETVKPTFLGLLKVLAAVLCSFVSGALLMAILAALLPNMLELVNLAFSLSGMPRFDWQALVVKAVREPWTGGLFVTGMLMTPIVPASAKLIIGLTGVLARLTPGAHLAGEALAHASDTTLTAQELMPVKITLTLARVWYGVAIAITVGLIAGAATLIHETRAPVGEFLSDVAFCATAWSHGTCSLF